MVMQRGNHAAEQRRLTAVQIVCAVAIWHMAIFGQELQQIEHYALPAHTTGRLQQAVPDNSLPAKQFCFTDSKRDTYPGCDRHARY